MTKIEIIDETIEYYKTHPRGVLKLAKSCKYKTDSGAMCAVGRCFNEQADFEFYGNIITYKNKVLSNDPLDVHLKSEYHGHGVEFWQQLQLLHDGSNYWTKTETGNELTEDGISFVNYLKNYFNLPIKNIL